MSKIKRFVINKATGNLSIFIDDAPANLSDNQQADIHAIDLSFEYLRVFSPSNDKGQPTGTTPKVYHKKQVQLQVEVKGVEERKFQLKSIVVIPTEVVLPGEKENRTLFIDCHCHLDRLFHNSGHRDTLEEYFIKKKRPVSPSFAGCVTLFCNP